jgi:hypothetical protein
MVPADVVTAPVPVVAMTTSSVVAGAVPPTHVVPVAQSPPVAVLVLVVAKAVAPNATTSTNTVNRIIR